MIMKILKKGDSREKGGGGNEIHAPCACGLSLKKSGPQSRFFNLNYLPFPKKKGKMTN
jgi:hypothetical protein